MSKLVWDATGERYVEYGVSKGVLYVQKNDGSYNAGVAWNGLISVSENPDGAEPNDLYADNIKYASLISAETFGATIEAYTYPDEFAQCDGYSNPVVGLSIGQQPRKAFGFCYRTEVGNDTMSADDDGYKLHIIYNAVAAPSDKDYETVNDSPDAITFSWEITTTPVEIGYESLKPTAYLVIDTTKLTESGKSNLAKLEEVLYGKNASTGVEASDPTLPTPKEIINYLDHGTAADAA